MAALTRSAIATVVVLVVAGCGGGEEQQVFTAADAERIAIHCYGVCPSDVDAATRAWVDTVDENARTGG